MSATPHKMLKTYPSIFGINEYSLSWDEAIQKKYICEYKFYYPNPEIIDSKIIELNKVSILSKLEINKCILINKAYYLLECIKQFHVKKIIVFLKSIEEANEFSKIINVLNTFFNNKLYLNTITCYTNKTDRFKILTRFKNNNTTINILCNVHILDEGIDIPECDSVYLTHPNHNPINFIQRISRCNRIKSNNSGILNYANVFIWAKTEDKIKNIDILINKYLNINNDIVDNIYIRTSINQKNKYEVSDISNIENNIILNDNLLDYLKKHSTVPVNFIDDFYKFFNNSNRCIIDLNLLLKWIMARKSTIKETLINSYTENTDYILKNIRKGNNGRPSHDIIISFDCM
jgi:superfamily II DNA or RNA helicase